MYSIAKTLGLPATYVELRHQATHEELPSLLKLRSATQKALHWIWDYYWSRLPSESIPKPEDCKAFVERLLNETDEEKRLEMESDLTKWGQDELLDVLMEIQSVESDVQLILRATQLQQRLLVPDGTKAVKEVAPEEIDWKAIKEDVARMDAMLNTSHEAGKDVEQSDTAQKSIEGWEMWEGTWTPKPIGVV